MINKKKIILLTVLIILILLLQTFIYKFGKWYEQDIGTVLVYASIVAIALFVLSPFKIIKDKRKPVSVLNYGQGMGVILAITFKFILVFCKEIIATITYIFVPKLFKEKKENISTEIPSEKI